MLSKDPTIIGKHLREQRMTKMVVRILLIFIILTLTACYPSSSRVVSQSATATGANTLASYTQVYFYPKAGQSNEQQSRDHFECYNWAIQQTGFDPSLTSLSPEQRIKVVPTPPPGYDTISLAVVGAVLGALIGGYRHSGAGALIGAAGGAIAGAASDAARQESARQMEEAYYNRDQKLSAELDAKALNFRRATGACLEGRGYSVK